MFERVRLLNTRKRVAVATLLLTSIVVFLVLVHYIRGTSYRPLYTELSYRDAASITLWLQNRNIDFTTRNHGRDIHIEADQVHPVRVELSRDHRFEPMGTLNLVPENGLYSILSTGERADITSYETQLARTIMALEKIERARVVIAPLRNAGTGSRVQERRVTVFINPEAAGVVTEADLATIRSLVSQSFNNLESGSVAIYDFQGRSLSSGIPEPPEQYSPADLFSHQKALEQRLEHRATQVVDALIGPGRSFVTVNVTLETSHSETTAERYSQDNAVAVKEHTEYAPGSRYTEPQNSDQLRYIPPIPTVSATDYEVDRTIGKTVTAAGTIKSVSVFALVTESDHYDKLTAASLLLSDEEIQTIRKALSSVISIRPERGDTVTVIPVPSHPARQDQVDVESSPSLAPELLIPGTKIAMLIVGLLFFYVLIVRPLLKILTSEAGDTISEKQHPAPSPEEAIPGEAVEEDITLVLKKEIERDPSPAVHIIKNWLQET